MSTAVAAPPVTAPLAPPSLDQTASQRTYATIAPLATATPSKSTRAQHSDNVSPVSSDGSSHPRLDGRRSPNSSRAPHAPKIVVKTERSSPELPTSRHRPSRLNLSGNTTLNTSGALTSRPSAPLTSKDSAGLGMHEVGLACLSPGFHTQDPTMREQLQRSIEMRDRQRQIIEQRQKGQGKTPHDPSEGSRQEANPFRNGMKSPMTSRRKGPPPGLSIAPPNHNQFANERVIQSAPLNQSFTGLRNGLHPPSRQIANQPSNLSHTSHIHHVPATQTNNRLPPIADVFPGEPLGAPRSLYTNSPGHSSNSNHQPPLPSPGFPPQHQQQQQQPPTSGRPREYKSAEEAVQSMSGGREDLLPRIVHYGGHQPPTPPSPMPPKSAHPNMQAHGLGMSLSGMDLHRSGSGRRRGRDEYERDMGTPPLGRQETKRGPFGEPRDSPETQLKKKEEFISLCARAWDLFHS